MIQLLVKVIIVICILMMLAIVFNIGGMGEAQCDAVVACSEDPNCILTSEDYAYKSRFCD